MLKVGCDPEVFIVNNNGEFINAHGLIPGTKQEPYPVKGGAVQVDGMAAEYNTKPVNTVEDFIEINKVVQKELCKLIPKDLKIAKVPVAIFDEEYYNKQPEISKELGCASDFNAYSMTINDPPKTDKPFRTAAGHLHLGFTKLKDEFEFEHIERCCEIVKYLDMFLGLPSLFYDMDSRRRNLYGKAGSFRPKKYGLEYRVLSNYWLNDDKFIYKIFEGLNNTLNKFSFNPIYNLPDVEDIINSNDKIEAIKIIRSVGYDY